jgi:hypothetical protein
MNKKPASFRRCKATLPKSVTIEPVGAFNSIGFRADEPAFYDPTTGLIEGSIRGHAVGVHIAACLAVYFLPE